MDPAANEGQDSAESPVLKTATALVAEMHKIQDHLLTRPEMNPVKLHALGDS